ncbi:MAG TPA: hypothetical protein VFD85_03625 [Gemmatimonadales bacterium]|nr:hypothetical protein [Gemmatimonadales bacterium]
MRRSGFLLLSAACLVAACERVAPVSRHTIAQSLKGVLVYPRSTVVDLSSGDSAGQMTLASPDAPDAIAKWFRVNLVQNRWTLENDARQPDGTILIFAKRGAQPLWISIQRSSGGPGSNFTVTGAISGSSDSTRTASPGTDSTQRSGSSMSSKRIHRR